MTITLEIDESRHREALKNFKEAGVDHIIDARLGNAHNLVPELQGPFDFVFSDADKGWYRNYFLAVDPKLKINGCYTTHNVADRTGAWNHDYLEFLQGLARTRTGVLCISERMLKTHATTLSATRCSLGTNAEHTLFPILR